MNRIKYFSMCLPWFLSYGQAGEQVCQVLIMMFCWWLKKETTLCLSITIIDISKICVINTLHKIILVSCLYVFAIYFYLMKCASGINYIFICSITSFFHFVHFLLLQTEHNISEGSSLSKTLCSVQNARWWKKSRNSVILTVMCHCQNPLRLIHVHMS
jgi:hypothetical protein